VENVGKMLEKQGWTERGRECKLRKKNDCVVTMEGEFGGGKNLLG